MSGRIRLILGTMEMGRRSLIEDEPVGDSTYYGYISHTRSAVNANIDIYDTNARYSATYLLSLAVRVAGSCHSLTAGTVCAAAHDSDDALATS